MPLSANLNGHFLHLLLLSPHHTTSSQCLNVRGSPLACVSPVVGYINTCIHPHSSFPSSAPLPFDKFPPHVASLSFPLFPCVNSSTLYYLFICSPSPPLCKSLHPKDPPGEKSPPADVTTGVQKREAQLDPSLWQLQYPLTA